MFIYRCKIRLKQTDATGVIYFSEQFNIALEAFEEFLHHQGFSLRKLVDSPYLMPIVHAEADYLAPVKVGDELEVRIELADLGTKSITIHYLIYHQEQEVGKVTLVHVTVDQSTRASVPIPDFIKTMMKNLKASEL